MATDIPFLFFTSMNNICGKNTFDLNEPYFYFERNPSSGLYSQDQIRRKLATQNQRLAEHEQAEYQQANRVNPAELPQRTVRTAQATQSRPTRRIGPSRVNKFVIMFVLITFWSYRSLSNGWMFEIKHLL